jgi:glucosamine-6-phosphate deaminase
MAILKNVMKRFTCGNLKVEIYPDRKAAGKAAAEAAAEAIRELSNKGRSLPIIFATGDSQLDVLDAVTAIRDVPWDRVQAFHMDEYVGLAVDHPASFCRYLVKNLVEKAPNLQFFCIDGTAADPIRTCEEYANRLRLANPQLCLMGIGENGHLAFNDPHEADFHDPYDMKVVKLDIPCRQQQTAEGWFDRFEDVPESAMTLTIPALFRVRKLIVSVPGSRKAKIVRRALEQPVSTECPATILRTHPDATVYLDLDSAADLDGFIDLPSLSDAVS